MSDLPMTEEEARAMVAALAKLDDRDEKDLYDCTVEELTLLVHSYQSAAAPADRTPFASFLIVLGYIAQVAGPVATIASAFTGVFGAAGAAAKL